MIILKKVIFIILAFTLILGGCARSKTELALPQPTNSMDMAVVEESGIENIFTTSADMKLKGTADYESTEPEKMIKTVNITMETTDFDKSISELSSLVGKYNGYFESSNISHNNYVNKQRLKNANYSIRVPKSNLDTTISSLASIGNIIHENLSKQDVTKSYTDMESRLKVLELKEERVLNLLAKADKMEDIILLENQLGETIQQKENIKANLISLDDQIDYSTIYLNLQEVSKLSPGEDSKTPFMTKLLNAFNDSLYSFGNSMSDFIIAFVYLLPYLIILGVICFAFIIFIKKRKSNKIE